MDRGQHGAPACGADLRPARHGARVLIGGLALWLMALGVGYAALLRYGSAPGAVGDLPARWPIDSRVALDQRRDTVLMFVHPECFCTRASLAELQEALSGGAGNPRLVLVVRPHSQAMRNWRPDRALSGAEIVYDLDGAESRRFGARISGFVLMYGADGALRFSGGITGSRGHRGDNPGRRQFQAALAANQAIPSPYAVFGCELDGHAVASASPAPQQSRTP